MNFGLNFHPLLISLFTRQAEQLIKKIDMNLVKIKLIKIK